MNLQQAYYEQRFEIAFLRAKGNEFQTLFARMMGLAYRADFMACRPWGKTGDRKNDGFLKSERRICTNSLQSLDFLWSHVAAVRSELSVVGQRHSQRPAAAQLMSDQTGRDRVAIAPTPSQTC
jgi:hypothetical protein